MLKPGVVILSVVSLAAGMTSASGNPFVGRWTLVSSRSRIPEQMKVGHKDGNTYAFDFGGGLETIVVDGSDQPGLGGSLLSVQADPSNTWIVKRKSGGRLMLTATWTLSSDGDTLTDDYRQFGTDGSTSFENLVFVRNGGGSGFVGDWQSIRATMDPPWVLVVKELPGDSLSIADPLENLTKNVALDRQEDPAAPADTTGHVIRGLSSSRRPVDDRTLMVTDKVNGQVRVTEELALSADLKVLTMTVHVVGNDKPYVLVFERT